MSNTETKAVPGYFQVLVVLYAMHFTMPIVGFYTPAIVHAAVLLFLYGFLLIKGGRMALSDFAKIIPIFIINILSIIYSGFKDAAVEIYWLSQLMIHPLLTLYLIREKDKKAVRRMVIIIAISILVTAITTYFGCLTHPGASRDVAAKLNTSDSALYALYMTLNIGSFSFIYAMVLLTPLLIYAIKDKLIKRWIGLVALLIVLMAVVYSEYTTALLCILISLIILFVFPKQLKTKHFIIMVIVTAVFMYASAWLLTPFLDVLGNLIGGEFTSVRLQELSSFSANEQSYLEGDMEARSNLYMKSIYSFLSSPIWGSSSAQVGGHSYVFDNMAKFGLIGIVGMIMMFWAIFKYFYAPFKQQKWYGHILFSFFMVILLAFLNPKDNLSVLTFYIPLFCVAFTKKKLLLKKKNNTVIKYENTLDC
jgi:O-antigen ligase